MLTYTEHQYCLSGYGDSGINQRQQYYVTLSSDMFFIRNTPCLLCLERICGGSILFLGFPMFSQPMQSMDDDFTGRWEEGLGI